MKLNELNTQNIGSWPTSARVGAAIFVMALVLVATYFLFVQAQRETLTTEEGKERNLRVDFEAKQQKAANLEKLKAQLEEMEVMLRQMLRQLPSKTEMPDLLVDISQTALSTGIDNELFEPGPEVLREFYAEKPISLRMVGSYHQFGAFVSGVASLPRVVILTMHDISLKPNDRNRDGTASNTLVLEGTVKTYRYVDEDEVQSTAPAQPAAAGRR